ncbi:hypothetical protein EYZ11_004893 [Aspergillus tanneri]|uniref:tRNA(His) guanylyltransferase n=1 Tax=Aspergillus tanneri TaxID=1220188 RepID=A0A4S3JQ73_9EURO|nr:hypothetical protein EYZ11_004893 [Aspergillus tanneri]
MANSKYEYVKAFEQPDALLPSTWIVVRIDGRGFHKLSDRYGFKKPNDRRALDLMNAAAVEVMKELPDLCIAYGVSDEYRSVLNYTLPYGVDCHINNLYNTTFWTMVQQGGMSNTDAERELQGTVSSDKNEILFKRFGINYNNEEEIYKKGSVLYRQYQLEDTRSSTGHQVETEEETAPVQEQISKSQQEKLRKLRQKAQVVIDHVDIIKDEFWQRRLWILSGKPGKLPV